MDMSNTKEVLAIIKGNPLMDMPEDLYIPPNALEILLESFEGPLDLLIYLIKKQNLDILDIPIAHITKQYMDYINIMEELKLELAAEYLLMAAMLAEIKSRMLLPRHGDADSEDEQDPRAELIRRLLEYERFKQAANDLDIIPRQGRDIFDNNVELPQIDSAIKRHPDVSFNELMLAFKEVLLRMDNHKHHHIKKEALSIRERMTQILDRLNNHEFVLFNHLFTYKEGRLGVVVTFIAILELVKQSMIELVQTKPYSPIHLTAINDYHD
jgi:segregation and condensation protein A